MTTEELLKERAKTHGSFKHHATITQSLKANLQDSCRGQLHYGTLCPEHREALEMIVHKIGRIIAGNPNVKDHWDDIAGYARLGSDACKEI